MITPSLLLATSNPGKINEMRAMLEALGIKLIALSDLQPIAPPHEPFFTFAENALHKAWYYCWHYRMPVLAEDSGLEVDVLDGAPGVFSARYAGEPCNDDNNNQKLLRALANYPEKESRRARYRAVACYVDGFQARSFSGTCEGQIAPACSGTNGFGYDGCFIPRGYRDTFGILNPSVKKGISHRGQAMAAFLQWYESSLSRHHSVQNQPVDEC